MRETQSFFFSPSWLILVFDVIQRFCRLFGLFSPLGSCREVMPHPAPCSIRWPGAWSTRRSGPCTIARSFHIAWSAKIIMRHATGRWFRSGSHQMMLSMSKTSKLLRYFSYQNYHKLLHMSTIRISSTFSGRSTLFSWEFTRFTSQIKVFPHFFTSQRRQHWSVLETVYYSLLWTFLHISKTQSRCLKHCNSRSFACCSKMSSSTKIISPTFAKIMELSS